MRSSISSSRRKRKRQIKENINPKDNKISDKQAILLPQGFPVFNDLTPTATSIPNRPDLKDDVDLAGLEIEDAQISKRARIIMQNARKQTNTNRGM